MLVLPALACRSNARGAALPTLAPPAVTAGALLPATFTPAPLPTEPPPPTTPAPEQPATPAAAALPPGACRQPPDDYTEVIVNGEIVAQRTVWMLERAKEIYPGPGDLLRVTQGSFREDVGSSFGTHAGGGAVDISIRDPQTNTFLFSETEAMVRALRLTGFAAWYRAPGAFGPGSPPHIHAVAVGDRDLAPAAQDQLTGAPGYFNGMDGLLPPYGPNPDPHGGPIVCPWMVP
jgi:hypothetical protein